MVRPRSKPSTTGPWTEKRRPSSAATRSIAPSLSAARISVEEIFSACWPLSGTRSMTSTSKPSSAPRRARVSGSPPRWRPRAKSSPMIRRLSWSSSTSMRTKSPASVWANSEVKLTVATVSRPVSRRSARRSSRLATYSMERSRRSTSRGWGWKVIAPAARSCRRARAISSRMMAWCPRWTPSKIPMVSAVGRPSAARRSCSRARAVTIGRSPAWRSVGAG